MHANAFTAGGPRRGRSVRRLRRHALTYGRNTAYEGLRAVGQRGGGGKNRFKTSSAGGRGPWANLAMRNGRLAYFAPNATQPVAFGCQCCV